MNTESERAATVREDRGYGLSFADALHDCLNAAVIAVSDRQLITVFNGQAEKLTGLSAADVLNHPIKGLPPALRDLIAKTAKSGQPIEHSEISFGAGPVRASAFPSRTKGATAVTAVLHSLAPAQKLEANMRRLDRLASVGALSASMAHEIKNAIVAVRAFVDILVEENKASELAPIVGREMRRIDSIVSQMLRVAGPAKPTLGPVRLHTVLDQALHLVGHQLDAKKLKARRDFRAASDRLHGDEYQLQQAFLNLFFNAIEAMKAGDELSVRTEMVRKPPALRVSVSDTGLGIPAENIDRLFDAFFTTKQDGTGLGLPITRRIVEEHKGAISVASRPNKGSTFEVTLPLRTSLARGT
jgi:signal transduction histidine kinase